MCQSDRIHDSSRRTFAYFRSNTKILCKANLFSDAAFRVQCLRHAAHFIDLDNTYNGSKYARAFRRPIEETRTMSGNTSLAVEKYKAVLCATGGTRNYV